MSVRAYLPATLPLLGRWWAHWSATASGPSPGAAAHAVTDRLRAAFPDGADEDWEYAALTAAAQDAIALLAESDPFRRVVVAVDVPRVEPAAGGDLTAVRLPEPVRLGDVAAVHVDSPDAEPVVRRVRALGGAPEPDLEAALDDCLDHELGWYATQEIPDLLELGSARDV